MIDKPKNLTELVAKVEAIWPPEKRRKGGWRFYDDSGEVIGYCIQGAVKEACGYYQELDSLDPLLEESGERRIDLENAYRNLLDRLDLTDKVVVKTYSGDRTISRFDLLRRINDGLGPDKALEVLKSWVKEEKE